MAEGETARARDPTNATKGMIALKVDHNNRRLSTHTAFTTTPMETKRGTASHPAPSRRKTTTMTASLLQAVYSLPTGLQKRSSLWTLVQTYAFFSGQQSRQPASSQGSGLPGVSESSVLKAGSRRGHQCGMVVCIN